MEKEFGENIEGHRVLAALITQSHRINFRALPEEMFRIEIAAMNEIPPDGGRQIVSARPVVIHETTFMNADAMFGTVRQVAHGAFVLLKREFESADIHRAIFNRTSPFPQARPLQVVSIERDMAA